VSWSSGAAPVWTSICITHLMVCSVISVPCELYGIEIDFDLDLNRLNNIQSICIHVKMNKP
jgi:hypothetical protein